MVISTSCFLQPNRKNPRTQAQDGRQVEIALTSLLNKSENRLDPEDPFFSTALFELFPHALAIFESFFKLTILLSCMRLCINKHLPKRNHTEVPHLVIVLPKSGYSFLHRFTSQGNKFELLHHLPYKTCKLAPNHSVYSLVDCSQSPNIFPWDSQD